MRQSTGTGPCVAGLVAGAGWLQVHREMAGREMKCREMKYREMEFLHIGAFATQLYQLIMLQKYYDIG